MAITDKKTGPWGLDQVYNKINQGSIWEYIGAKELWAWGSNYEGKGGWNQPTDTNYSSPIQIPGTTWTKLASYKCRGADDPNTDAGNRTMFALRSDDTMWGWGQNETGELGLNESGGSDDGYSSPKQIPGSWSLASVTSAGAAGIKTDGTLWAWGSNTNGQLGDGSKTQRSSPVQIPGTTWSSLQGYRQGNYLAFKTDGTLWGWGNNQYGQLGQNNRTEYSSPRQIPGTWSHFPAAGAGGIVTHVFKTDGTLWGWGSDSYGSLGLNTRDVRYSSPVQIPGTTWDNVAGSICFLGHKTDGTLWMMGRNIKGALGQNNRTYYSSPVQIPGTTWTSTIFGNNHQFGATKTDGTLWMWGANSNGIIDRLPNDEIDYYSSPVQIPGTNWADPADVSMVTGTMFWLKDI